MSGKKRFEIDQSLFDYSGDTPIGARIDLLRIEESGHYDLLAALQDVESMLDKIDELDQESREEHLRAIIEKLTNEIRAAELQLRIDEGIAAEDAKESRLNAAWEGHDDRKAWALAWVKMRLGNKDMAAGEDHIDLLNAVLDMDKQRNPLAYIPRAKGGKGRPLGREDMNTRIKNLIREMGLDLIRGGDGTKKS